MQTLLRLLSDPNEQIAQTIQEELAKMGTAVLPILETAKTEHPALAARLDQVIQDIHFPQLLVTFRQGLQESSLDWEQGAFLIARLRQPTLERTHYQRILDQFAEEFHAKWNCESLSIHDAAQQLAVFLFKDKGFSGNQEQYYDPDNSFMHLVIDRRLGIPITLAALYVFVAARVGIPAVGIGMPGHFLVRIEGVSPSLYLDAFNKGSWLKEQDCRQFIAATGLEFQPHYVEPSSTPAILSRMLRNLLSIYEDTNQETMRRRVEALLDCFDS